MHHLFQWYWQEIFFWWKNPLYENAWALTPLLRPTLLVSIHAQKTFQHCYVTYIIMVWHHMTMWCHGMRSHDVYCHDRENAQRFNHLMLRKFNLATLTFGFNLDLWIRPRYCQSLPSYQILGRTSSGSAGRSLTERHAKKQTDRTDFIPSTADAGGKYILPCLDIGWSSKSGL